MNYFLPTLFVSHGSPGLLLSKGPCYEFLRRLGTGLPRPKAIICISAHWETDVPAVSFHPANETIHDFHGFPEELYRLRYPAPVSRELTSSVCDLMLQAGFPCMVDDERGLDHGAWVPLMLMYPDADIPVMQLSVQPKAEARLHYNIGRALRSLRGQGVLIVGSGGATHNLRGVTGMSADAEPVEYAVEFDRWLSEAVERGSTSELLAFKTKAPELVRNHPTVEHFLPLFVPLGAAGEGVPGRKLFKGFEYGVLSMAAYIWGL